MDGFAPQLEAAHVVIAHIGKLLSSPDLALDGHGRATLVLEGAVPTAFICSSEGDRLSINAVVGTVHMDDTATLLRLLNANYLWSSTGGGVLGISPGTNFVSLALSMPLSGQTAASVEKTLEPYFTAVRRWNDHLGDQTPPFSFPPD